MSVLNIPKKPNLITSTPSDNSYKNLSQSELLEKVKALHEQVLQTNKYLSDIHRMSVYNWDSNDTGNIMVQLPDTKKGFLLDSILRLRGVWDPSTNTPALTEIDTNKIGWIYKVATGTPVARYNSAWKSGDYALYDENGLLYNVQNSMLETLFTPIVLIESNSIQFDPLPQNNVEGIQLRANVKIDPEDENDITVSAQGIRSDAYKRAKALITIQETAPTEPNTTGGLKIVYLPTPPETFYDGYLYLIPPASIEA